MKKEILVVIGCWLLVSGCQPKVLPPISSLIGKVWKAKSVKEGDQVVFTQGANTNIKPGYANFRLNLSQPDKVVLIDIDNRPLTGTWTVSPDNKRLILENLLPKPTNTIGTVEFFIVDTPTDASLHLQRTAESRKTGNSINEYELIPE